MELFKNLMSKVGAALMALCFVTAFALAAPQEAEAGEFELGGDFGYVAQVAGWDEHGFGFTLYGGYRFLDWVGVYLDQQLSGVWAENSDAPGTFLGSTVVNARFFLPVSSVELWGQIGMGAGYRAYEEHSWGAFAFKLGLGAQFEVTNNIAIGGKFAYQVFANDGTNHVLNLALTVNYKL